MKNSKAIVAVIIVVIIAILGYVVIQSLNNNNESNIGDDVQIPNPASVYCESQGGTVENRTNADGGEYGVCVLADGTEHDEWDFFRNSQQESIGMPNPASVYCESQGGTVENRTDADGGEYGVCVLADGTEHDEWEFFRNSQQESIGMPNPASVYCESQGGTVEIRTDADGGEYGVCILEDGTEHDEWEFFRNSLQENS